MQVSATVKHLPTNLPKILGIVLTPRKYARLRLKLLECFCFNLDSIFEGTTYFFQEPVMWGLGVGGGGVSHVVAVCVCVCVCVYVCVCECVSV